MKKIRILACDLSLTGTAFALLEFQEGFLLSVETFHVNNKSNAQKGMGHRLQRIADQLEQILEGNEIDHIVREKGFSRFPATTQALFRVVGVVDLVTVGHVVGNMEEYAPTAVKKSVTGDGKASKEEVAESVRKYLPESQKDFIFETDDCSDAVAVGITWAIKNKQIKQI